MDNIKETCGDFIDIGLKLALDSKITDEIPIVGTISKIGNIYRQVSDYLLNEKLIKFFNVLTDTSIEERERFLKSIKYEEKHKKINFIIISILDKVDEDGKEEIIGKLFKSLIQDKLTLDNFKMLSVIVNKSFLIDIITFINHYTYNREGPHYIDDSMNTRLMNNGLLNIETIDLQRQLLKDRSARKTNRVNYISDNNQLNYKLSNLGNKFINSIK